ncbi:MAG: hypothetical protein EBQ92_10315 [Proteobacteria bacterium]|nr:hypothetical protein [Pseudomonadota bacterium]
MNRLIYILLAFGLSSALSFSETSKETVNFPGLELTGTFSVLNPNRLILSSREYKVSYSKSFLGISAFQLGVGLPLRSGLAQIEFYPFAKAGYARNQGTYSLTAQNGETSQADVTLHWVPLTAGLRTEYNIPGFDLIRPFLILAGGAEWLNQRGETPGLSENFWIPFYNVGLGLSFSDSPYYRDSGFGGFSFSMNFQNGLRRDQETSSFSYDLTVHFFL